jgi:hypothetical protein
VTKWLLGGLEAWGADESSLPIHLAVRLDEGVLYLGTGRPSRAEATQPAGGGQPALTNCGLRLDTRLSRTILDRVRPTAPASNLPGLGWLLHVDGDRAAALEQFVSGWYPAVEQPPSPSPAPTGSRSLPGRLQRLYPAGRTTAQRTRTPQPHPALARSLHRSFRRAADLRRREPGILLPGPALDPGRGGGRSCRLVLRVR